MKKSLFFVCSFLVNIQLYPGKQPIEPVRFSKRLRHLDPVTGLPVPNLQSTKEVQSHLSKPPKTPTRTWQAHSPIRRSALAKLRIGIRLFPMGKSDERWIVKSQCTEQEAQGRLAGRGSLVSIIQKNKLGIIIPRKRWFPVREQSISTSRLGALIVERMVDTGLPFTLRETQQLAELIYLGRYADVRRGNIFKTEEGPAIIDTGAESFVVKCPNARGLHPGYVGLLQMYEKLHLTPRASLWLTNFLAQHGDALNQGIYQGILHSN